MSDERIASMIEGLKAEGLTASQIARESGLSRHSLWRYTVGEARQPSLQSFDKLALVCRAHGLPIPQPGRRTR